MKEALRLFRQKRYDLALKEFLDLHVEESEYPEFSYYLGLCYTQLGKYEEALLYLEQVVSSDLDIIHIYQSRMILGYIYAITGRYRLGQFEFGKLLENGFESAKVYAAVAYVLYKQQNYGESLRYLEKALVIDPNNANALNSAGYILCEQGKQLKQALEYCRKAVSLDPDNPVYLDSLGWVYFKLGKMGESRNLLRNALNRLPGNREIAGHLKKVMSTEVKEAQG